MNKDLLIELLISRLNEHVKTVSDVDYGRIEELAYLLMKVVQEK